VSGAALSADVQTAMIGIDNTGSRMTVIQKYDQHVLSSLFLLVRPVGSESPPNNFAIVETRGTLFNVRSSVY